MRGQLQKVRGWEREAVAKTDEGVWELDRSVGGRIRRSYRPSPYIGWGRQQEDQSQRGSLVDMRTCRFIAAAIPSFPENICLVLNIHLTLRENACFRGAKIVPRTPWADVYNPYPPLVIRGVSFAHAHLLLELLQLLLDGVRPLPTATAGRACPAAGPAGACSPTAATGASAGGAAVSGRARAGAVSPTRATRVDLLARTPRRARLGVLGVGGTTATGTPPRGTHDMHIHQTGGTPDGPRCDDLCG